jgi:formylglycine-generating enzyme required for sulfatase activity
MKRSYLVAALLAVFTLNSSLQAELVTFGSGANTFNIDFLNIGNAGNAADTTTYGAVPYEYRMGKYEISQDAITKATASGMANVTAGAWTGNQPAANIDWYEAAAFVNWLNTSTGKTAAYDLAWNGFLWSMNLWSSEQAWTAGGTNLYRNKDAFYFLPSDNEWYKAAYYNPAGSDYFLYPTASSSVPTAVASGTNGGSAVYNSVASVPAIVDSAGGLSPYGTMGQGGNVFEWNETAFDGTNSLPTESRAVRGGSWGDGASGLISSSRSFVAPERELDVVGFRVASVDVAPIPEPGTWVAMAIFAGGAAYAGWRRRRRA